MARFYDHLKRDMPRWKDQRYQDLAIHLNGAMVIDATNLSDYLYANESKGEWDLLTDLFNLAPPFEKFFVECKAPKNLRTPEGEIPWPKHLPSQWGVLFMASEVAALKTHERHSLPTADTPGVRWVLQAILLTDGGLVPGIASPQFCWWFPIKADGTQPSADTPRKRSVEIEVVEDEVTKALGYKLNFVPNEEGSDKGTLSVPNNLVHLMKAKSVDASTHIWQPNAREVKLFERMENNEWKNLLDGDTQAYIKVWSFAPDLPSMSVPWQLHYTMVEEKYWLPLLMPCAMTISWLHVKNVTVERVEPPKPLKKKAKRTYGEPLCDYHVLRIQPFRKTLETAGGSMQTGIRHALHLCRGHFHHYGEAFKRGKLFGKLSGTFWVPSHMRGNPENGLMDKGYSIQPPKAPK